jgi:hypothetical protein
MPESSEDKPPASTGNHPPIIRSKGGFQRKNQLLFLCLLAVFVLVYLSLSINLTTKQTNLYSIQNKTVLKQMRQFHLEKAASSISRAYPQVSPSTWCIDGALRQQQSKRRPMGLCYLKLPRAASSTLAGS